MEKVNVSKHPTLEIISETEPNDQRTNYTSYNPRVRIPDSNSKLYKKSTQQLPVASHRNDGHLNQGYATNSQSSIHRDGSTPSVGGYVHC